MLEAVIHFAVVVFLGSAVFAMCFGFVAAVVASDVISVAFDKAMMTFVRVFFASALVLIPACVLHDSIEKGCRFTNSIFGQ